MKLAFKQLETSNTINAFLSGVMITVAVFSVIILHGAM